MRSGLTYLFVAVATVGSCWGCGGSSPGAIPKTYPVKGKVTYKGQALVRGTVHFEPEGAGKDGAGEIQPDGTYALSTYKANDGAVPGRTACRSTERPARRKAPNSSALLQP